MVPVGPAQSTSDASHTFTLRKAKPLFPQRTELAKGRSGFPWIPIWLAMESGTQTGVEHGSQLTRPAGESGLAWLPRTAPQGGSAPGARRDVASCPKEENRPHSHSVSVASHGAETCDSDLGIRRHWKSTEVVSLRCTGELGMEPGKGHSAQRAEDSEQVAQENPHVSEITWGLPFSAWPVLLSTDITENRQQSKLSACLFGASFFSEKHPNDDATSLWHMDVHFTTRSCLHSDRGVPKAHPSNQHRQRHMTSRDQSEWVPGLLPHPFPLASTQLAVCTPGHPGAKLPKPHGRLSEKCKDR
ncbi:uncharacterized protein [Manis javanica]|uniref:uncharacterized protein n=1 Tax=Manis javanica TaxID=9974 RepID=UPI003C6D5CC4